MENGVKVTGELIDLLSPGIFLKYVSGKQFAAKVGWN